MKKNEQVYYIPPLVFPHPSVCAVNAPAETASEGSKEFVAALKTRGSSPLFLSGTIMLTFLPVLLPLSAGLWLFFADCRKSLKKDGLKTSGLAFLNVVFLIWAAILTVAAFAAVSLLSAYSFVSVFGGEFNAKGIIKLAALSAMLIIALIHAISAVSLTGALASAAKKGVLPRRLSLIMPITTLAAAAMFSAAIAYAGIYYSFYAVFAVTLAVLNAAGAGTTSFTYLRLRGDFKNIS